MSWLRIDDGFTEHRKLVALTRSERWTWLELLCYCARQQNQGHIPAGITDVLKHVTNPFLAKCVTAGLLDVEESGQLAVHDWEPYNPKDPTKAERQARWRKKHKPETSPVDGDVDDRVDENVDSRVDISVDASRAGARARPVPSPRETNPGPVPQPLQEDPQEIPNKEGQEQHQDHTIDFTHHDEHGRAIPIGSILHDMP